MCRAWHVCVVLLWAAGSAGAQSGAGVRVVGCEHFAFLRPSMSEGLGGPALEALKSWDGEKGATIAPNGDYLQIDPNNSVIYRIRDGVVRVLAGDGTRGGRDGPADQAQFDFGCGAYSDADIACDASGAIYVSEQLVGRLRRIERRDDGTWHVSTVAGGGERMPRKGEWIDARQMKQGCTSRFAVTPDGAVYFASHGGVYEIRNGRATCVVDVNDLKKALGDRTPLADWHVGGSHITPDGMFYWMPGGGPNILRLNTKTGAIERFAGTGKTEQYLDGPTLLESSFHTVLICYNRDASVMYTCGGDESIPRRIAGGRVMALHRDGTFRPSEKGLTWQTDRRWKNMGAVQCLDEQGRLYIFTGDYSWGGWVVRFTFAKED